MKTGSILALAGIAAAADYADFKVPRLTTNMPNGYKFGYWNIDFNVTSQSGASPSTSWCYAYASLHRITLLRVKGPANILFPDGGATHKIKSQSTNGSHAPQNRAVM
jgi:hypothetical protein